MDTADKIILAIIGVLAMPVVYFAAFARVAFLNKPPSDPVPVPEAPKASTNGPEGWSPEQLKQYQERESVRRLINGRGYECDEVEN